MRRVPKPSKRLMRKRMRARSLRAKVQLIQGVRRTRFCGAVWVGESEHADAEPRPQAKEAK